MSFSYTAPPLNDVLDVQTSCNSFSVLVISNYLLLRLIHILLLLLLLLLLLPHSINLLSSFPLSVMFPSQDSPEGWSKIKRIINKDWRCFDRDSN